MSQNPQTSIPLNEEIYQENINFWNRAWSMVRAPYTQLPDLEYLDQIPKVLQEAGTKRILDLGCGSGWLSIFLAKQGFEMVGIDLAPHAIELGNTWAQQEGLSIEFKAGDIISLDFPKQSFDAVIANSIFEHLPSKLAKETVAQIKTILKSNGLFYGVFDKVGGGPGEYFELDDSTHVYTDKGRKGMLLRCYNDEELRELFNDFKIDKLETLQSQSRILIAKA